MTQSENEKIFNQFERLIFLLVAMSYRSKHYADMSSDAIVPKGIKQ